MEFISSRLWWIIVGILGLFNLIGNAMVINEPYRGYNFHVQPSRGIAEVFSFILCFVMIILAFIFKGWQGGIGIIVAAVIINTINRIIVRAL